MNYTLQPKPYSEVHQTQYNLGYLAVTHVRPVNGDRTDVNGLGFRVWGLGVEPC